MADIVDLQASHVNVVWAFKGEAYYTTAITTGHAI